jgi:hypothetical protein
MSPTGNALVYSTFLGGSGDDGGVAIALVLAPKSTGHVRPDFMRVLIGIR